MVNTVKAYDDVATTFADDSFKWTPTDLLDEFSALLTPGSKILDVGCGSGMFLYEFEKMGLEAFGTDISNALLERFKGKSKTFACAAHELPFYDEFFNRILMVSVAIYFENFNYFKTVVLKCLSILKLQGIFLIGDINLGIKPDGNQYQWYNKHEMVDFLDSLGYPYSIMTQNKIKRTINKRWDILIYKE